MTSGRVVLACVATLAAGLSLLHCNDGAPTLADSSAAEGGGNGVCAPLPNPGICGSGDCQAWAQSLTTSGFAHASCGTATFCQMGDRCGIDSVTGFVRCTCGTGFGACENGEVCVSDTPDGPATCRPPCVPRCPAGCTTAPCVCPTTSGPDVCTASGRVCPLSVGLAACESSCPDAGFDAADAGSD